MEYEMGWNDVLANIRKATNTTSEEKDEWLRKLINGHVGLPRTEPEYKAGAIDAAKSILNREATSFKGPQWVIEHLKSIT